MASATNASSSGLGTVTAGGSASAARVGGRVRDRSTSRQTRAT